MSDAQEVLSRLWAATKQVEHGYVLTIDTSLDSALIRDFDLAVNGERPDMVTAADYVALKYLYEQCQLLRECMRDSRAATFVNRAYADHQTDLRWRCVEAILEKLALNERHPAEALAMALEEPLK